MGELLKFPGNDIYFYVKDGDKIVGCGTEGLSLTNEEGVVAISATVFPMDKSEVKQLMIMWLALNYPDVLKYDEESGNGS